MFHMKSIFYLFFIHWIVAIPQINLYFTDQVRESENYDEIGIRYNCIRLASNMDREKFTRQISSYCMSESSLKFHIENDNSFQTFSFAKLAIMNITSEDLYFWSTPIDIIEQYQIYLLLNDSSLAEQIFYNCTLPRFGSMCQYEFYYYHESYSSLYEMIHEYYQLYYSFNPTNLTCYTHVKCNRGYSPACLDWTEICDGKVDCLDGEYDEEHCWELEFNECKSNEYQCNIGLCIPNEFIEDDKTNFDCIDGSDEPVKEIASSGEYFPDEPAFGRDDMICGATFVTSPCLFRREVILMESMFSIKDNNVTDECWSAYKCYFAITTAEHPNIITYNVINKECIPIIRKTCPDMLYIPNIPIFFGHIYTAYKKNELSHSDSIEPPYLCSNKSFYDDSLSLVLETVLNNTMCFKVSRFTSMAAVSVPRITHRFQDLMDDVYQRIKGHYPIINFPLYRCSQSHLYQCINSSKCISFHRLINGVTDCPYNDDENIYEDTNPKLFAQVKHKYYKCHVTNKYISQMALFNNDCDCEYDDYGFCEDLDKYGNFTRRTISFQTICDGFQELYPITIDGKNETDETECEQWECDNIYTHCDKIWNCLDGKDEINCDSSLPPLLNCSSGYVMCVTSNTSELTCLPIKKANDGIPDCLGGTDEPKLCRPPYTSIYTGFYCPNNVLIPCLDSIHLCTNHADCFDNEDEQFCQKNPSFVMYSSICNDEYISSGSDAEKFLCDIAKEYKKERTKYFTIDGFNQSYENEVNGNQQIDVIPTDLLDDPRCHRGLDLCVWLNKSSNHNCTSTCLCPPSYYGNQCQYQNQRLSLSIRFHASAQSRQILFAILIMLVDNTNQRMIHSYEQFTYLSIRDCKVKFNIYLVYSSRPKAMNKNYSIHIDMYEKISLRHRGSFIYPVEFLFLPVHRLAFIINIPSEDDYSCSDKKCLHGKCLNYFNTKETFCQCDQNWSGQYCDIPHNNCNCSSNSICIARANDNRSICICREDYFGSKCYLRNRICDNSQCQNNGLCIPYDDFMLTKSQEYFCICPNGFSGIRCELINTQVDLIFDKDIHLSHSIFIHFIKIVPYDIFPFHEEVPKPSPERSTTLQTISQATNSIRIYWSQPFHLMFIETLDKMYYLTVIQPVHNYSTKITQRIKTSHHCPSINELVNDTFTQLHVIRRMKYYHSLICQKYSPNLLCFHDDIHICLCYDHQGKRLANCFNFNHQMKFDCFGKNYCEHGGDCFQDSPTCPTRSICVCPSCYYGTRCQFTTSEFGLSLDAILAYHIIPDANIIHQTSIIKTSLSITILFMIFGLINGILSLITFKNKSVRQVGCGIYLLGSSITTILTMIMFGLKYFTYLSTQISTPSNQSFLTFQCYSFDFLLRICLNMDQWLNACVAMERAITIIKGVQFDKKKSKQLAKKVLIILLILNILTLIHDPIYRSLFEEKNDNDDNKTRIWCIVNYSSNLQIYDRVINTFHFFVPFLINLISSIILITKKSHQQSHLHRDRSYKTVLHEQLRVELREHKRLLIAPVVLFLLALPRLILSYSSKCMDSTKDSWVFLFGYFISFIPLMITFIIFVLPSDFYKKEYQKTIVQYKNQIQQYFRRTI